MALRLVRQTSETPNVTNKDDTIMTRYAYGGYNGVVKAFGSECGYTAGNGIFKVLDGRIVIDGWEIDVDGGGWSLDLHSITGTQYHTVYAEINVATETIKIYSTYLTGSYPIVEKGDDLTGTLNGTARLVLYNVKVENGSITEVVKKVNIIPYLAKKVLDVERRLEELGFKEGVATVKVNDNIYATVVNSLTKKGVYAIFNLELNGNLSGGTNIKILFPEEFKPKSGTKVVIYGMTVNSYGGAFEYADVVNVTDGVIEYTTRIADTGYLTTITITITNAGWEIVKEQ